MQIQKAAAKRYGCSFQEAVRRLGAEGCSINEAAFKLGYKSGSHLRRMVHSNGWGEYFLPQKLTNGGERRAKNLKRNRIAINGVVDSFSGHSRRYGLPRSTAWKRYTKHGPDWGKVFGFDR